MGLYKNKGPHEVGLSTGQNLVKPKLRVLVLSFAYFGDNSFICRVQQALLFGTFVEFANVKGPLYGTFSYLKRTKKPVLY